MRQMDETKSVTNSEEVEYHGISRMSLAPWCKASYIAEN